MLRELGYDVLAARHARPALGGFGKAHGQQRTQRSAVKQPPPATDLGHGMNGRVFAWPRITPADSSYRIQACACATSFRLVHLHCKRRGALAHFGLVVFIHCQLVRKPIEHYAFNMNTMNSNVS
jgi:hypothetical protein